MKQLNKIIEHITYFNLQGSSIKELRSIELDSRKCVNGSLFVAHNGTQVDGHNYIDKAIENGAKAVVCEELPKKLAEDVCFIQVINSSVALGKIASAYYDFPSKKLKLIGVTGTNGKTSIVTLLYELVRNLGIKAGLLSTIKIMLDDKEINASHTTPDAVQINKYLSEMLILGCEYAFMEVSSHAVDQNRIVGLNFTGAVFTNLTHDHLDYHQTFANYRDAKKKFFDQLSPEAFALVNLDDKNGSIMLQNSKAKKSSYAVKNMAAYMTKALEYDMLGTHLIIDNIEIWTQFVGKFNVSNILAVYAVASLLNFDKTEVLTSISALKPVKGRFESMMCCSNKMVIVDYAHTPDALENVLETINDLRQLDAQIYTVFGAGGDRDKSKRSEMGAVAEKFSDKIIITSDNPRTEDPSAIIEDIYNGISKEAAIKVLKIADRAEAIKVALMMSKSGDIVLIAGKGHEDYQEINGVKHHFDDKEIVLEFDKSIKA